MSQPVLISPKPIIALPLPATVVPAQQSEQVDAPCQCPECRIERPDADSSASQKKVRWLTVNTSHKDDSSSDDSSSPKVSPRDILDLFKEFVSPPQAPVNLKTSLSIDAIAKSKKPRPLLMQKLLVNKCFLEKASTTYKTLKERDLAKKSEYDTLDESNLEIEKIEAYKARSTIYGDLARVTCLQAKRLEFRIRDLH